MYMFMLDSYPLSLKKTFENQGGGDWIGPFPPVIGLF